jgi:hypothetical protein
LWTVHIIGKTLSNLERGFFFDFTGNSSRWKRKNRVLRHSLNNSIILCARLCINCVTSRLQNAQLAIDVASPTKWTSGSLLVCGETWRDPNHRCWSAFNCFLFPLNSQTQLWRCVIERYKKGNWRQPFISQAEDYRLSHKLKTTVYLTNLGLPFISQTEDYRLSHKLKTTIYLTN